MSRRTTLIFGVILLLLAPVVQAQGQGQRRGQRPGGGGGQGGPGGFGGGPASMASLLGMPEVQKELTVTEDQKGLIDDMLRDLRQTGDRGGFNREQFQNLSQEERQKRFEEMRKQAEERTKKSDELAKMILEPKQIERLNQLVLQRTGAAALERQEVADKLGLTADQKDKIRKIREASRPERGAFDRNASREEQQKAAAEARERRAKADADVLAVLTPQQKETWEKLLGKKFDFPQPQGRGRPGGNDR